MLLNSGIKVNSKTNQFEIPVESNHLAKISYNFPSSIINLDVSRDRILNLKINDINLFKESLKQKLSNQALALIELIENKYKNESLLFVNQIIEFGLNLNKEIDFMDKSYSMLIKKKGADFIFIACKKKQIESFNKDMDIILGINIDGSLFVSDRYINYLMDHLGISTKNIKFIENIKSIVLSEFYRSKEGFYDQTRILLKKNKQESLNLNFKKLLNIYEKILNDNIIKTANKIRKEIVQHDLFENYDDLSFRNFGFEEIGKYKLDRTISFEPLLSSIYQLFLNSYTVAEIENM